MTLFLTLALLLCAVSDFLGRKIHNAALVLMMVVVALAHVLSAVGWAQPYSYSSFIDGSLAFALAFIVSFVLWRFKLFGGGDVKLLAVLGFCFGLKALLPIVLLGTVATGVHALVLFTLQRIQTTFGFMIARLPASVPYGGWLALSAIGWMQWNLAQ